MRCSPLLSLSVENILSPTFTPSAIKTQPTIWKKWTWFLICWRNFYMHFNAFIEWPEVFRDCLWKLSSYERFEGWYVKRISQILFATKLPLRVKSVTISQSDSFLQIFYVRTNLTFFRPAHLHQSFYRELL